ncbi:unnamed protein product [Alopecurus aequalis]
MSFSDNSGSNKCEKIILLPTILARGTVPLAMISSFDGVEACANSESPNIKSSGRNSLDDRKPCQ